MVDACFEQVNNVQKTPPECEVDCTEAFESPNRDGYDDMRRTVLGGQIQTPTVCNLDTTRLSR